ncbi:MAG: bifunctional UDP-N-acetylglucosamine diphosphorylase/glucosamine-1-phosphate N-acetyltransferase GlmU [Alphaproteobacteria bacterium]|nr:bifunctional UDP-N-acetylglucosamine diphosphorylase/glucosamine-1-phosphate N-acetyltransferase GlmU [Alphaproteobacteria bacterium]
MSQVKPTEPIAAVILGAGKGTRMKSDLPKVLHKVASLSLIGHVIKSVEALGADRVVAVAGPGMDNVKAEVAPHQSVTQTTQLGTGDAVKAALPVLQDFKNGTVLVLVGDAPFINTKSLQSLVLEREKGNAVVVLGFEAEDPTGYGRLISDENNKLSEIVEHKDATETQRAVNICNSGILAIDAAYLADFLSEINNENASGEYYLTDVVGIARHHGLDCGLVVTSEEEVMGINSRVQLSQAETIWQNKRRREAMEQGATLTDPTTVYFAHDTKLGRDVIIGPNVVFGPAVEVSDHVEIKAFCHIEGAKIASGCAIGPYARLRPGAVLAENAFVGNFVEIKNTQMGQGAKASHLSYLGDSEIGAGSNIGAGTITCNYDGFNKAKTVLGEGVFIGSNSSLVAPVHIGDGALVSAGSVITKDVESDAMAFGRSPQKEKSGMAAKFRAIAKKKKEAAKAAKEEGK